jgi:hypothetical protein
MRSKLSEVSKTPRHGARVAGLAKLKKRALVFVGDKCVANEEL